VLHDGSTAAEQGDAVGGTGRGRKAVHRGQAPFIAGRGGGRRAAHVGSAKPWAVGACGHRRGNGGAAVWTGRTRYARACGSCPADGLGPF
jgi:hypothetical protein